MPTPEGDADELTVTRRDALKTGAALPIAGAFPNAIVRNTGESEQALAELPALMEEIMKELDPTALSSEALALLKEAAAQQPLGPEFQSVYQSMQSKISIASHRLERLNLCNVLKDPPSAARITIEHLRIASVIQEIIRRNEAIDQPRPLVVRGEQE